MGVFSYPELYTTAFGWLLYGALWNVLTVTGIAWIPFLVAIYQNTREPMEAQEARDATQVSIRRMFWSIGVMILVVAFCAVPTTRINVNTIKFTCQATAANSTAGCLAGVAYGESGTGFDTAALPGMPGGASGGTIDVPVFWAGMSSITSGLISGMVYSLPSRSGIREVQNLAAAANIADPELRNQVQRFTRECYGPAMNKLEGYLAGEGTSVPRGMMDNIRAKMVDNGRSMDYIGNRVLLETIGLYAPCPHPDICGQTLTASAPVRGLRGFGDEDGVAAADAGIPNCAEWWGVLRENLKEEAAVHASGGTKTAGEVISTLNNGMIDLANKIGFNFTPVDEDLLVQQATGHLVQTAGSRIDRAINSGLNTARAANSLTNPFSRILDPGGAGVAMGELRGTAQSFGLASEQFSLAMKLPLIMKAAPLVQSVLIMVMIALFPLILVIGRYSLGTLVACGIGYFTVRFWTVLWAIAAWTDELLTGLFAGNQALGAAGSFGPNDASLTFARYAMQMSDYQMSSVVQLTTAALFVGMPMIFSMLLGWAGVIGISGLNEGMKGMMASTENAGNRADQSARAVAGTAVSVAGGLGGAAVGGVAGAVVAGTSRAASEVVRK